MDVGMSVCLGKKKVLGPMKRFEATQKIPKRFFDIAGAKYAFNAVKAENMDGWFDFDATSDLVSTDYMFQSACLIKAPLFDTSSVATMKYMFSSCTQLTDVPEYDTKKVYSMERTFFGCSDLVTIPKFDTSKVTNMKGMFYSCSKLAAVPAIDASLVSDMTDMFRYCSSLEEIHMTGMKVSFDISASTKFTREALAEILSNLAAVTSTKTLTMGSANLAKLSDDDKAVATGKGWTLA